MNGGTDPYASFLRKPVQVVDVRGVKYVGVLRALTYHYVTLDDNLVLTRDHVVALWLKERDG